MIIKRKTNLLSSPWPIDGNLAPRSRSRACNDIRRDSGDVLNERVARWRERHPPSIRPVFSRQWSMDHLDPRLGLMLIPPLDVLKSSALIGDARLWIIANRSRDRWTLIFLLLSSSVPISLFSRRPLGSRFFYFRGCPAIFKFLFLFK